MALRNSLTLRLVVSSALWIVCTLIAVSALLIFLFTGHIERRFDAQLGANLRGLIASVDIEDNGRLRLDGNPLGPNFSRPLSGWYWQVSTSNRLIARSGSSDQSRTQPLVSTGQAQKTGRRWHDFDGPKGQPLRAVTRTVRLPNSGALDFLVSGPRDNIIGDVKQFTRQLLTTMGILAIGLMAAILLQVRLAMRPLRRLQRNLAQIRGGQRERLPHQYPEEMMPVVSELNELLGHNESIIEQARVQGANLAHAIKNPLTVIQNEANRMTDTRAEIVRDQVAQLTQSVERHLTRFRSAGAGRSPNARTMVAEVVEDLIFSMQMIHQDRSLTLKQHGVEELQFKGERHDLEEMLGNLLDNACKWASTQVTVRGERHGDVIRIHVDDDGPGIPSESRQEVLKPGRRLDETVRGTGLGLAIVQDMVDIYRGQLHLGDGDAGGTRATLELPAAT